MISLCKKCPNTEYFLVRIREIWTRESTLFGHFSRIVCYSVMRLDKSLRMGSDKKGIIQEWLDGCALQDQRLWILLVNIENIRSYIGTLCHERMFIAKCEQIYM